MAQVILREYANVGVQTRSLDMQEPANADQTLTSSAVSAQSAAFNAETRLITISTVSTALAVAFGKNPTALITSLRLPGNGLYKFAVRPGDKVAVIDVT